MQFSLGITKYYIFLQLRIIDKKEEKMLKKILMKICQRNTYLYNNLRKLNRKYIFIRGNIQSKLRLLIMKPKYDLDVNKVITVKPSDIIYCCETSINKYLSFGKVLGGNWDKNIVPFERYTGIYNAMVDTFKYGKPFENSDFYKNNLEAIKKGEIRASCRDEKDFKNRIKKINELFADIMKNGFKLQSEIKSSKNSLFYFDDITVHIDREGHFLFADGQHRLAIAKLLKLKEIPVRVAIRHSQWINFRREVLDVARHNGGKIYQKILHPDLCDIPSYHGDERKNIIENNLTIKYGDVLDIGAHWGYFCHYFEEKGFNCVAIENDPVHLYFLKKLRRAGNRRFSIINEDILNFKQKTNFDIVIALNIFHHFIKTKKLHTKLVKFLKSLDCKIMFFEPHLSNEFEGKKYYRNYSEIDFVNFILENSNLNKYNLIGTAEDGRRIFKLEKE